MPHTEKGTRFPRAIDIADGCDVATGAVSTYCSAHYQHVCYQCQEVLKGVFCVFYCVFDCLAALCGEIKFI